MQNHIPVRWRLRMLALFIICLGSMAGPLAASAAAGGCRADPKAWLSNDMKLTMTIGLSVDAR